MTRSRDYNVGILGGGQLGLMLALAGHPLGITCAFVDPAAHPPAGRVARHLRAGLDDVTHLDRLAACVDVVTFELEGVPLASALHLAKFNDLRPGPRALEVSQDRMLEKQLFAQNSIATAPWKPLAAKDDLRAAADSLGYPVYLKQRHGGYDGRGQKLIREPQDCLPAREVVLNGSSIVERHVSFDRELSLVAVRGLDGSFLAYPLVENYHHDGILRVTVAPAPFLEPGLQRRAETDALRIMEGLEYVGTCTLEFFQVGDDLVANEIAPRVHNSGHWTIEGAETSQFENHLRAILGLPLGSTEATSYAAMINLLGEVPDVHSVLTVPGAALHLYGKDPRPNRKLGHVTVRATDRADLRNRLKRLNFLYPVDDFGTVRGFN